MRVSYKDMVIECDWAVRHEDKVVLGTRSKEIFYIKCCNRRDAYETIDEMLSRGRTKANRLGVVLDLHINNLSDLLCESIFDNAVFDLISCE